MRWIISEPNAFPVGWHMPSHRHQGVHELVLVCAGRLTTRMEGRSYVAEPGMLMLHPSGSEHAEQTTGGRPLSTLYAGWQAEATDELAGVPSLIADRHGRIEGALRWLMELVVPGTGSSGRAAEGLLTAILHEVRRCALTPEDRLVGAVRSFVQARLGARICLGDLARVAGMSSSHFSRRFHDRAGCSPMAYVRQLRMQRARHLLLTTHTPLAEVAALVGFGDALHFSRVFRRASGLPPGRLRSLRARA